MKKLIALEELAQMIFALACIWLLPISPVWWVCLLVFFLPDVSILGYVVNSKTGAIIYNLFHHKATAILIVVAGFYFQLPFLQFTGILFFAHSAFDRMLGYGLKHFDSFTSTHLGRIGKQVL